MRLEVTLLLDSDLVEVLLVLVRVLAVVDGS